MSGQVEPELVAEIVREIAAAVILPRFRRLGPADIHPKGRSDFATIADLEAEQALAERLVDLLPGSVVVGEEGSESRPELLHAIAGPDPVWIIDPLDGTHNFAGGNADFAVIVALARAGETLGAWIYHPLGGAMATAERGAGAFIDGARLAVAPAEPLEAMRGAVYGRAGRHGITERLDRARAQLGQIVNRGCAGIEYLSLVRGEGHFGLFTRLKPWDHAAGVLLHAEAGGIAACFDGEPYRPTRHAGGLLLAPDAASWQLLAALLLAPAESDVA